MSFIILVGYLYHKTKTKTQNIINRILITVTAVLVPDTVPLPQYHDVGPTRTL